MHPIPVIRCDFMFVALLFEMRCGNLQNYQEGVNQRLEFAFLFVYLPLNANAVKLSRSFYITENNYPL